MDAITNIHIKLNSCIVPSITKIVFKSFLHQAITICSEIYIKEETKFSIDISVDNGYKRKFIENSVEVYNTKKKDNKSRNYTNSKKIPWTLSIGPTSRKEL